MKSSKIFVITWVLFSSVAVSISSKDVISKRQLWTNPKYAPSISSSYSNINNQNEVQGDLVQQQASGSSLAPSYSSYITSQVSSSTSEVEEPAPEDDISNGSESQQVDTIEQYSITKEAESYPQQRPNNQDYKQSNGNGSNLQQEAYSGPDLTLQSRPVVYTPPHVTFHPPQIIISEAGIVFTDPHTTYSHELPSGPQEGGQMIAYQPLQVQVASSTNSHLPQNVQVSYPQLPQQGGPYPQQQQPVQPQQAPMNQYRQQIYPLQQQQQPQMNYNNNINQYQGAPMSPPPAIQGAQVPYQHYQQLPYPLQYPVQQQQQPQEGQYVPQQQQMQQQPQEGQYVPQQQQMQQQQMPQQNVNNGNGQNEQMGGINNRDGARMRLKRGQPQKESSSTPHNSPPVPSDNTPHGRWPLSTITFHPVNKK